MCENKGQDAFGVFGSYLGVGLQRTDHRNQGTGGADLTSVLPLCCNWPSFAGSGICALKRNCASSSLFLGSPAWAPPLPPEGEATLTYSFFF